MKYVLVDRENNIVDRVELTPNIDLSGARMFFVGRKQIESEKFDQIWKVMTEIDYNKNKERKYKHKEFGDWLDIEKS